MRRKHLIACATILLPVLFAVPVMLSGMTVHDFLVNPSGLEQIPQFYSNIVFDQYGNFVVAWVDRGLGHQNRQVYFQRYDSLANPIGTPVLVSDTQPSRYMITRTLPCLPQVVSSSVGMRKQGVVPMKAGTSGSKVLIPQVSQPGYADRQTK